MVKSRLFKKKTKESLEDYDNMSKFIDPTIDYTKEELCDISTPKKYDPSPAENFHLPPRHVYSSFIDFTAKKFSEHIEDPLNPNEIEEGCRLAREIVNEFASSAPEYTLTQNDLTKEIKQGLSINRALSCINNSKFRDDFIDFLGEYQMKHINDRGLKNGIKEPIKRSHKVKIIKYYEDHKTTKEICKELLGKYSARVIDEFIEFYLKNGNEAVNMEFTSSKQEKN
ncbi:unnamed protein product [Blepharisma stoltei]|uniref:Uncharacterized protein n=1 Tax=Blepharisma stoltei TaxID=1481888 RepID=A0AAU9KAB0_9CILI|nr:unnamed protein product [Blepharisma stoltei]